jgi:SHS2 domain-containing protein
MRLEATSVPALFIEAARAVAEVIRGRPLQTPRKVAEEVSITAPDPDGLLVAWIGELVRRSVESRLRFEEFDIIYVSDRKLVASIRGVRLEQIQNPLKSTTYHAPSLVQCPRARGCDARARGLMAARVLSRSVRWKVVLRKASMHDLNPGSPTQWGSHDLSR